MAFHVDSESCQVEQREYQLTHFLFLLTVILHLSFSFALIQSAHTRHHMQNWDLRSVEFSPSFLDLNSEAQFILALSQICLYWSGNSFSYVVFQCFIFSKCCQGCCLSKFLLMIFSPCIVPLLHFQLCVFCAASQLSVTCCQSAHKVQQESNSEAALQQE